MTLQELFDRLAIGELTNLSLANGDHIATTAEAKLVNYTNEALLKLYSRYVLKENDLLLALCEPVSMYKLLPRFSVNYTPTGSSDNEPYRYILDLPESKFQDEVLKVLRVYDEMGHLIPLNNDSEHYSVFTPQAKTLQVPNPITGKVFSVVYQCRPTKLQGDLSEEFELPEVLEKALTSYIAYLVFDHMNSADSVAKAQNFLAKYENECGEVVDRDLVNSSTSQSNIRFYIGGWV